MLAGLSSHTICFRSVINRFYEMFEVEALMPVNQEAEPLGEYLADAKPGLQSRAFHRWQSHLPAVAGEPVRLAAMVMLHRLFVYSNTNYVAASTSACS